MQAVDVCSCGRGLRVGVAAHTGTMQDGSRMGRERAGLRANHSGRRDRRQEAHGTAPVQLKAEAGSGGGSGHRAGRREQRGQWESRGGVQGAEGGEEGGVGG